MLKDSMINSLLAEVGNILKYEVQLDQMIRPSSLEAHLLTSLLRTRGITVEYHRLRQGARLSDLISAIPEVPAITPTSITPSASPSCGLGVDLVQVNQLLPEGTPADLKADKYLTDLFTLGELSYAACKSNPAETLGGLYAAKEALVKATQIPFKIMREIEIRFTADGRPIYPGYDLSISHDDGFAIAIALPSTAVSSSVVNLLYYCDSLGFRRAPQSMDFGITYPFKLASLITQAGYSTNVLLRGRGGMSIREFAIFFRTDLGYLMGEMASTQNVLVIQIGSIDAYHIYNGPHRLFHKLTMWNPTLGNWARSLFGHLVMRKVRMALNQVREAARLFPEFKLIVVGLPDRQCKICDPKIMRVINTELQSAFSEIAQYIDVNELNSYHAKVFFDGDHLTEYGHQSYAELILARLLPTLQRS